VNGVTIALLLRVKGFVKFNTMTKEKRMPKWEDVLNSLENPKYKWRTLRGVAEQLNSSQEEILKILNEHEDEIIKSSIPAGTGEDLYTTRRHYRRMTPVFDKILSSVTGTVTSSSSSSSSTSSSSSSSGSSSSSSHNTRPSSSSTSKSKGKK
jgi:hypothetical protein